MPKIRIVLVLALIAGIVAVWMGRDRGHRALAAYKAGLIARGEKLALAEVFPRPASLNDPAESEFRAAVGALRGRSIQPGSYRLVDFVDPGALKPLAASPGLADWGNTVLSWEALGKELEAVRPSLDALHRAVRSPAPRSAVDYRVLPLTFPNFIDRRAAAQWLALEASSAARATNHAAALEALQALLSLADLHREDAMLVNQMIRVAISGLAFDATLATAPIPGWTESQLAALQAAWERPALLPGFASAMEGERAWGLAAFEQSRTNSQSRLSNRLGPPVSAQPGVQTVVEDYVLDPVWRTAWVDQDQLHYLKTQQAVIEAARAAVRHQSWRLTSSQTDAAQSQASDALRVFDNFRHRFSHAALPNWKRALEHEFRAETQRALCVAALAVRRYELQHAAPPPSLEALIPDYLAAVPVDFMDGQALRYAVQTNGSWRLYSVGLDGADDGGDPRPPRDWSGYTSIWDGRDAVWPHAASDSEAGLPANEVLRLVYFEEAPLGDALNALARQARWTLVFDPAIDSDLRATVSIRLMNVTAVQALETLLANHRLAAVHRHATPIVGITRQ